MSGKTKQTAQLEPRVNLCDSNPYVFLTELERLILAGYRLDLNEMFTMFPGCYTATVALPEAATA